MHTSERIMRACGYRVAGGIYLSVPSGPNGHEIDCFLADPPQSVDAAALGVSARGVTLVTDSSGVTHVLDWIGVDSYPNVADFLEEAARYGISRRIAATVDFARLTPASRLVLLHPRAIIRNRTPYRLSSPARPVHACPASIAAEHCGRSLGTPHAPDTYKALCSRLWWEDVRQGDPPERARLGRDDQCRRTVGSTTYRAYAAPRAPGEYALGIIGRFPLGPIEVIADREGGSHEDHYARARQAQLPVHIVPE